MQLLHQVIVDNICCLDLIIEVATVVGHNLVDRLSCSLCILRFLLSHALDVCHVLHLLLTLVGSLGLLLIASFGLLSEDLSVLGEFRRISMKVLEILAQSIILLQGLLVQGTFLRRRLVLSYGRVRIFIELDSLDEPALVHDAHEGRHRRCREKCHSHFL